jgi:hypothetical protein
MQKKGGPPAVCQNRNIAGVDLAFRPGRKRLQVGALRVGQQRQSFQGVPNRFLFRNVVLLLFPVQNGR